jgi:hypothetical protein
MRKYILTVVFLAICPLLVAQQALNNDSIIKLVKTGQSDDLVVATINASPGTYDTSADGLAALKAAGVSDKVIAAIVVKVAAAPQAGPALSPPSAPASAPGPSTGADNNPNRYTIEYVHSGGKRKPVWDTVSEYIQNQIIATMELKGFRRATASEAVCCKLTFELVTNKTVNEGPFRPLADEVTVNLTFADGSGRIIYKKEYQGKTNEFSARRNQSAPAILVKNITSDESFNKALTAGAN